MDHDLTIAEAADELGLSADTLRYYERDGLLLRPVGRAGNGHRRCHSADLRWILQAKGCAPGQLALAWVLAQGDDELGVVPIPGTKRIPYLEENVAAAEVVLDADDLRALEEAVPVDAVAGARYGDMSSIDA